ncbi:MAG: hypothetical protein AB7F86_15315 [Bdellovibrionales bacterium]
MGIVLVQFQNCAPAIQSNPNSVQPEVRIVDDWNKAEIQFASTDLQIQDELESVEVSGLCTRSHNGAALRWSMFMEKEGFDPILAGQGSCESGQFRLEIGDLEHMVCGVTHRLVVEGDWGGAAYSRILKRCQPLATEIKSEMADGTQCLIEYSPSGNIQSSCTQVCYRQGKVVYDSAVDPASCTSLMQKLASP